MKCLLCGKEKGEGNWKDILIGEDPLCSKCRKEWDKKKIHFNFEGIPLDADYVYNKAFSSCLIQYKECGDEALKDVFLYEVKKKLKRRYHGWTLVMMPSSNEKLEKRGFSHLKYMFRCLGLPIIEPFIKTDDIDQKGKSAYQRQAMMHDIVLKQDVILPEKLVLCDDTITTGSTLRGALQCLDHKKHQLRIYCVSVNASWL